MRLDPELEAAWAEFRGKLLSSYDTTRAADGENAPLPDRFDEPIESPLSPFGYTSELSDVFWTATGARKSPLIRLDVAVMACHLLTARLCLRVIVSLVVKRLNRGLTKAGVLVELASYAVKGSAPFRLLVTFLEWTKDVLIGAELNLLFIEQADLVRYDGIALILGRGKTPRRRVRQYVYTRRLTQRQRKPNKSWPRR